MQTKIIEAYSNIEEVKLLFQEYSASLGIDLEYQNYAEEFANLPGKYKKPDGRLYLALVDGVPVGCAAMRRLSQDRAEMKWLYVKGSFRGQQLGRRLAERVIASAHEIGCRELVLDTLSTMDRAQGLYRTLGFVDTEPYYEGAYAGTVFLRLLL